MDEGGIEVGDGCAAEEAERALDIGAQNGEGAGNTGVAARGEAVGISAADEHDASAEADGFDDVAAAANAAVHEDFGLTVDGSDNFGKHAESGGATV